MQHVLNTTPYALTNKSKVERKRRDDINRLIDNLGNDICPQIGKQPSQEDILFTAVQKLTGINLHNQFAFSTVRKSPGGDNKETRKKREQVRRDKQDAAYAELKNCILRMQLGTKDQREKLEKMTVLLIITEHFASGKFDVGPSTSTSSSEVTPIPTPGPLIFPHLLPTMTPSPTPSPIGTPLLFPPVQPMFNPLNYFLLCNMLRQQYANQVQEVPAQASNEDQDPAQNEDGDVEIDICN